MSQARPCNVITIGRLPRTPSGREMLLETVQRGECTPPHHPLPDDWDQAAATVDEYLRWCDEIDHSYSEWREERRRGGAL